MPNVSVDPLALAALVGFAVLIAVSIAFPIVFWRLSKSKPKNL